MSARSIIGTSVSIDRGKSREAGSWLLTQRSYSALPVLSAGSSTLGAGGTSAARLAPAAGSVSTEGFGSAPWKDSRHPRDCFVNDDFEAPTSLTPAAPSELLPSRHVSQVDHRHISIHRSRQVQGSRVLATHPAFILCPPCFIRRLIYSRSRGDICRQACTWCWLRLHRNPWVATVRSSARPHRLLLRRRLSNGCFTH